MDAAGVVGRLGESTWQSDSPSAGGFPVANFPEISNGSNGKFLCLYIFIESSCARPCRPPSHSTPTDQVAVRSVRAVRDRRTQSVHRGFPVASFPAHLKWLKWTFCVYCICIERVQVSGGAAPCPLHSDRPQSGGRDTVRTRRRDASSAASRCPCTRLGQQQPSTAEPPARLMRGPRRAALREDHRGAVHPARRLRPEAVSAAEPPPPPSRAQELAPDLKAHMQGPASGWTLPEWWDV